MNLRVAEGDKVKLETYEIHGFASYIEYLKQHIKLGAIYTVKSVIESNSAIHTHLTFEGLPDLKFIDIDFTLVLKAKNWIPLELELPKARQTVYVIVEVEVVTKPKVEIKQFQTMAQYIPYLTVPENDFIAEEYQGDGDYDEEKDEYYTPEGWYEYQLETEIHYILSGKVTHWMPLFELPKKS